MLHYIWMHCHVGERITAESALGNPWAFTTGECRLSSEAKSTITENINLATNIYMSNGTHDVMEQDLLQDVFADIGSVYGDFTDTRSLGDAYGYDYEIPIDFFRILNDDALCPGFDGHVDIPDTTTPSEDDDDMTYWEWYDETKARLEELYPENPETVQQQLEYLDCLGINETFGVPDSIGDDNLQGSITANPHCAGILEQIENGSVGVVEPIGDWGNNASPSDPNAALAVSISVYFSSAMCLLWALQYQSF